MNDNMDDDDAADGLNSDHFVGQILTPTGKLTRVIEAVQAKINTARVQAGSQYAALESAVAYTTDLTAQYELGYNTVNDVNFSMETAHLAKNQILQQAATAMLAQANSGQQGLLQLLQ
jgi:flagellin